MPRKALGKKAVSKRTYALPQSVADAFDAVVSHFDEDKDRVARRFFEDGLRAVARTHNLSSVLELLGEPRANPFDAMAQTYEYQAPPPAYVPSPPVLPKFPTGDFVMPSVVAAPLQQMQDEG